MYELADQSWKNQPNSVMSERVVNAAAERIGTYAASRGLERVLIDLHGGEPLLADRQDKSYFSRFTDTFRRACHPSDVEFTIQTNGTLITDKVLGRIEEAGIDSVGVSIDGTQEVHDAHRTHRDGRGSFDEAAQGIELLASRKKLFSGLLSVINIQGDPQETYDTLSSFNPPAIDFLFPLANHTSLPPGYGGESQSLTPYADWLLPIFDQWFDVRAREHNIRFFSDLGSLVLDSSSAGTSLGLAPSTHLVIETDGQIQGPDSYKSLYEGAADLGMNVFDNTIAEAMSHPKTRARQLGMQALSETCQQCDLVAICGGGLPMHRWKAVDDTKEGSFANPSVYCDDLKIIINHAKARLSEYRHIP